MLAHADGREYLRPSSRGTRGREPPAAPSRRRETGKAMTLTRTLLFLLAVAGGAAAQSAPRTYANPIDIDYRYNGEVREQGLSYRAGADPVIVRYRDGYYLFETLAGGYWHSPDLVSWHFVTPSRWPFEDMVAPAALAVGDTIFLMRSATAP